MAECVHKGPECTTRAAVHIHGARGYTGVSFCRKCAQAIFFPGEWTAIELALNPVPKGATNS